MEYFVKFYDYLFQVNHNFLPLLENDSINKVYIHSMCVIEIVFVVLLVIWFFKVLFSPLNGLFKSSKTKTVSYSGGFRRRFERVNTNVPVEYRLDRDGEYSKGICRDISLHGMKLELNADDPQLHQRVEVVIDGKRLRLPSKERIKIGGFIVRVVKKKNKVFDVGVEFYHLFKNQMQLIESLMKKKKK